MTNLRFKVGDFAYLAERIVEPANEDHPQFLMGERGERVEIKEVNEGSTLAQHIEYPYSVEGPTNSGKTWRCADKDLMTFKPFGSHP